MAKCLKCAASWTSPGMTLCPICGAKVGDEAVAEPSQAKLEPQLAGARTTTASQLQPRKNGTSVLKPVPAEDTKHEPDLKVTYFPRAHARPGTPPTRPIPPKEEPPMEQERMELPRELPKVEEKPLRASTRLVDASVALLAVQPKSDTILPSPARPLNGPLILGALAMVTGILLPVSIAFESNKILGVMGFCLAGFFVPFAPIAWIAGLSAEKRRREQGLRPEGQVVLGRQLGQWGTVLLVSEVTVALILIAALRLAGTLPPTFFNR